MTLIKLAVRQFRVRYSKRNLGIKFGIDQWFQEMPRKTNCYTTPYLSPMLSPIPPDLGQELLALR